MSNHDEYNKQTGFYKSIKFFDSTIQNINYFMAIYGIVSFILLKINKVDSLPNWIESYNFGIIISINAILILVMNNAHNRYYIIYSKHLELSTLGNLVDFTIKLVLIMMTIFQLFVIDSIIFFSLLAYLLTFIRNIVLIKSVDSENPLYSPIKNVWIKNNMRHNISMIICNILYYVFKYKIFYIIIYWLLNEKHPNLFLDEDFITFHYNISLLVLLFFDIYWIQRILKKIKISKNNFFKSKALENLFKELEDYNNEKDK